MLQIATAELVTAYGRAGTYLSCLLTTLQSFHTPVRNRLRPACSPLESMVGGLTKGGRCLPQCVICLLIVYWSCRAVDTEEVVRAGFWKALVAVSVSVTHD